MLRYAFLFLCFIVCCSAAHTQTPSFPQSWEGKWTGTLHWYKTGSDTAQQINMELHILPGDSTHTWQWKIIYQTAQPDQRPYTLKLKDAAKKHWIIDEHNGIILDQFLVGNKLCGSFSVGNAIINNCYQLQNNTLVVEFYTMGLKALNTTGLGTDASPSVNNYAVYGYQHAVLRRQ